MKKNEAEQMGFERYNYGKQPKDEWLRLETYTGHTEYCAEMSCVIGGSGESWTKAVRSLRDKLLRRVERLNEMLGEGA